LVNKLLGDKDLLALRPALKAEEELMRRGIFSDPDTGKEYFTGYAYKTLYDWDQYFESIVQIYMGWDSRYIQNGVTIFLDHQQENGMISRSVPSNVYHDPEHVKPFLAQIAWLVYRAYGEHEWVTQEKYLYRLRRYLDYWLSEMDGNGNGLSEWMSAPHTGMDNQHERAGFWLDRFCEGVDLNCYLVRECKAFAHLCRLAGKTDWAEETRRRGEALAERIRVEMWDETDGFFYDRNARAGEEFKSRKSEWGVLNFPNAAQIKVKSVSSFAPLWAGVATPQQAKRMIFEHLFNPREFWTPYPLATLAKSERWYSRDFMPTDMGCNWRAKVWIPTNYMVCHGLRAYGYTELAALLSHYTVDLVRKAGNREYYDAETGEGNGLDPFWGWSLLAHFMDYESAVNSELNSLDEI
jgi:putative isomerase